MQPGVLRVRSDGQRMYAEDFKAELVRQCLLPGTSVAATAMAHNINANLLRRWIGLRIVNAVQTGRLLLSRAQRARKRCRGDR
jgi:transposase-like protein